MNNKTKFLDGEIINSASLMGRRAIDAKSYFDQILDVATVAMLLKCRVSDLKVAAASGGAINGKSIPAPALINGAGHMFWNGRDIEKLL